MLSISLTLLLAGLAAGLYCYCRRPAKNKHVIDSNFDQELSNLLKLAHDTSIQRDSMVNSARNSRIVEGCAAGLTSTSQANASGAVRIWARLVSTAVPVN